ncbi:hypothetical protein [Streptomyces mirabilis]
MKRGHVYEPAFAQGPAHALSAPRFAKELGPVDERVMEAVEIGLRAVFDL